MPPPLSLDARTMSDIRSISPEREMWQAVLLKAFTDATAPDPKTREDILAKRAADSWIRNCGRDFRHVCALAGMSASFLSEAYLRGRVSPEGLRKAVLPKDASR
jgi:hypothetical protein